ATMRDPGNPDRRAAAPHLEKAARATGQAVFYAAAAGEFAYDDDRRKNGVFTGAVLDALRCSAGAIDEFGLVTIDTLGAYVHESVKTWVEKHGNGRTSNGIQVRADGGMRSMPVAVCRTSSSDSSVIPEVISALRYIVGVLQRVQTTITGGAPLPAANAAPPPQSRPAQVRTADDVLNVFSSESMRLWRREVAGPIVHAEVADLDGDAVNEVVVGVGGAEGDGGKVIVFDARGNVRWSADTTMPLNYDGGHTGRMTIRAFTTGDLFRKGKRQVVVLAIDAQGWYPAVLQVYDWDGKRLASYRHPGHLHKVLVASATPRSEPRIIVSGVNNDLSAVLGLSSHASIVVAFDPKNIAGEAPPQLGRSGPGSQLWYGVVLPETQLIERLEIIDQNQDGLAEISVWTSSRTAFYLDFSGRVVATQRGDGAVGTAEFALVRTK
ncbi:MAG TPA: hypothetical protein VHK90_05665, partial [Thermoanaerobaculia bacterium]|nr:hypothetical protein [Thermoanaerobaculia bacterium]